MHTSIYVGPDSSSSDIKLHTIKVVLILLFKFILFVFHHEQFIITYLN